MYLAATVFICQVQCNVLPKGTSGFAISFLGNAAVVCMVGYSSLLADVELHCGMLWTQIFALWCLDVLCLFLPSKPSST